MGTVDERGFDIICGFEDYSVVDFSLTIKLDEEDRKKQEEEDKKRKEEEDKKKAEEKTEEPEVDILLNMIS